MWKLYTDESVDIDTIFAIWSGAATAPNWDTNNVWADFLGAAVDNGLDQKIVEDIGRDNGVDY